MNWIKRLGPGLLFAGAAIGVSHLVQSTKAGALFGFDLLWVVIAANIIKYPFFQLASSYTAHTGTSVLRGYKDISRWTVYLVIILTLATMFIIQAGVTLVTAGLAENLFRCGWPIGVWSALILASCALLVLLGRYSVLDTAVKAMILLLSICTLLSVCMSWDTSAFSAPTTFSLHNATHIAFLISLIGWMPAPLDCSIWASLWAVEKSKEQGNKFSADDARFDFRIGQLITTALAVCFVALGAFVMHGSSVTFSPSAAGFAAQLVQLYTNTLGSWSWPIIATAAFLAMFSTTLTCLDAFPRVIMASWGELRNEPTFLCRKTYTGISFLTLLGALIIILFFTSSMKQLIGLATFISFCTTPIIAVLNTLLLRQKGFKQVYRPSLVSYLFIGASLCAIIGFTLYFIMYKV